MKEPEPYMGGYWGAKRDLKRAAEPPPTQPPVLRTMQLQVARGKQTERL